MTAQTPELTPRMKHPVAVFPETLRSRCRPSVKSHTTTPRCGEPISDELRADVSRHLWNRLNVGVRQVVGAWSA